VLALAVSRDTHLEISQPFPLESHGPNKAIQKVAVIILQAPFQIFEFLLDVEARICGAKTVWQGAT
jgi:hypothetical protein